jgi:CO/xanthine dehydrogenase Mo-binding subunit
MRDGLDPSGLTPEARSALAGGVSRRDFLKASGALVVTFSAAGIAGELWTGSASAQGRGRPGAQLDSWIAIAEDGSVTAYTGKCELGQGLYTAQAQLIAEELVVPLDRVTLVQCDTDRTPDQGTTSGAQSHPANFNHQNLALAAASAREALVRLASERLGAPANRLSVKDGMVSVAADPSKTASYGSLLGGRRFAIALDPNAKRRHPREWTVLGQPVPRLDLPAMATGQFEYVHNVRVPGMLHGQVVRPPAVGATVLGVDEASVRGVPGLVKVVVRKNFVGVVAEKPWPARQAAEKLKVTWSRGVGLPDPRDFHEQLRRQRPTRDTRLVDSKNVDETLARAATVVRATYRHPYQMHGSLGSSCAVADVHGDKATIWSATQAIHPHRMTAAMLLGLRPENVRVVFRMGSGCYGLNGAEAVSYDAALLSQAVGKPVRVQLSRKDEMAWENYGLACVVDQRVGLDDQGNIMAWDCETWVPSLGGRPGVDRPGNVVTGFLAGFEPAPLSPRAPAPDPESFNNGSNGIPSYVVGRVGGRAGGTGTVAGERVLSHWVTSPFFTGPLRSPQRLQNTVAHECFLDELAHRVKADPLAYRLKHLGDPRLRNVLTTVGQAAGWEARPSPRPNAAKGIAAGRGVACVLYEGDNGYCAMVAEVEVDQDEGDVSVKRLFVALDCGPVSNPDGLRNQIEGGALQGLSRALGEEVTWDDQRVTSVDWRSYRSLSLGYEAPVIETVLVNPADAPATGAGETSVTVVAAALGNAIFDATGARVRQLPFTRERMKAALLARA